MCNFYFVTEFSSFLVCVTFFSISQLVVRECLQTKAHLPTGDWNKATTWRMIVCLGMCKHSPILPSSRQHPPGTHQPVRECTFYLCGCITSNINQIVCHQHVSDLTRVITTYFDTDYYTCIVTSLLEVYLFICPFMNLKKLPGWKNYQILL